MLNEPFEASRPQVPVYLAALAAAPHTPGVRSGLGSLWAELRAHLADDIARQLEEGRLPEWVPPSAMAAAILSLVNGVIIGSVIDPELRARARSPPNPVGSCPQRDGRSAPIQAWSRC